MENELTERDKKKLLISYMSDDEMRVAKAWAAAYGVALSDLLNTLLNRLEMQRYDLLAAAAREIHGSLSLDEITSET